MSTEIVNVLKVAGDKAQYDSCAKRLLSQKRILAHILVRTVEEFRGIKPEEMETYIEGDPVVGEVPAEPGLTNKEMADSSGNRIAGLNTENSELNEGQARFDILFYVRMRDGLTKMIVNVEAQKSEPTEYPILNRSVFYASRMISSEKGREFQHMEYGRIIQVHTIWICMNMDSNILSHIHLTKNELLEPYPWKGRLDLFNIVMIGVANKIPPMNEAYAMHRLIGTLFSNELKVEEKLDILSMEYGIPISDELREDVTTMCNLSQGIADEAMAKGRTEGRVEGEERTSKLISVLLAEHDYDGIRKVTEDPEIRKSISPGMGSD